MKTLGQIQLKRALSYDPETGVFVWVISRPQFIGKIAGHITDEGYRTIRICGKNHKAHRLAWLYVHGEWPCDQIDHVNGRRSDNRIANLRVVTHQQNVQNTAIPRERNKSTGVLGVDRVGSRYRARIKADGVERFLGSFGSLEAAEARYWEVKRQLHCTGSLK